ncbi:4-alpha-glucanotransferase [Bifidobacterium pseudocatenulatum]|uniref:4-alpha-glucanotransferase n=1 Tax=Bifidobacterium pseudocatenulatum TaxID=28026 RepID=UPI0018A07244|nr:4-alpha-glucanotransferase [Bifidobacterium pseudocatenulatum]MDB6512107.1 4-alpha-glucanotransferase [Bifidobacterium pseudocatenulatum]MDB6515744.1 4-alpha-glucanotransferase [Bifidobacterium pseudocatenulatum]
MTATQQTESAERIARPLIQLAKLNGISTSYIDQLGTYVEIRDEVLVSVLAALGVDASSDEAIAASYELTKQRIADTLVEPTIVKFIGKEATTPIRAKGHDVTLRLLLEDGTRYEGNLCMYLAPQTDGSLTLTLPDDIPAGYHTLRVNAGPLHGEARLICAPARVPLPPAVAEKQRWGWMAQMYSIRSAESWGVGDYGDLKLLLTDAAEKSHADFMLINPIHATAPVEPLEPSPYLPESRRFMNVTYIRPQDIEEYAGLDEAALAEVERLHAEVAPANDNADELDINSAWWHKRQALQLVFKVPRSAERQAAFEAFKEAAGPDLRAFAAWSVAFQVWGAPWEGTWFAETNRDSPEVAELMRDHADMVDFECWLQWIADEQVTAAQTAARESGMALGLMQDMAVGVHSLGADVWWNPERFAVGSVTVGCPPDFYNQQGQDWGQPPFNPNYLAKTGYGVYREMVHNMFSHAGAVRIDHVLGLFRLWWIPQGEGARGGAYVTYDYEAMIAILTIEASRVNGLVVGEDLGTVPDYVRTVLAEHGLLGCTVEWFARVDDSPNAGDPYADPADYRKYALASVTTHDLPPTAGYLQFEHVKLREELNLLTGPVEEFQASATAERQAMLDRLVESELITPEIAADVDDHIQEIVEAMHKMLLRSPSVLLQAALVDGVGETRSQNQPGTSSEYCNWRVPLAGPDHKAVHTDEVFDLPRVKSLSAIMNGEK